MRLTKPSVNGKPATVNVDDPQMPLLYALRDELGLARGGCGDHGQVLAQRPEFVPAPTLLKVPALSN